MELALEAGAEDVEEQENDYRIVTTPEDFTAVRKALVRLISRTRTRRSPWSPRTASTSTRGRQGRRCA